MQQRRIPLWRQAVSMLCASALLVVAVGYRPAVADQVAADPDLATYLLLGGSLDALCLADGHPPDGPAHLDCPACISAKTLALVPTTEAVIAVAEWTILRPVWAVATFVAQHGPRSPPARGPPSTT
jgi:hypothetical protein